MASAKTTPFDVVLDATRVGPMLVTRYRSAGFLTSRPEGLVARNPGRFVKLRLYRQGRARLFQGASTYPLDRDAVHLVDHSRAWTAVSTAQDQLTAFIPHGLIGYDPARHPVCSSFPLTQSRGGILADMLLALERRLPDLDARDAPAVMAGFAGLLGGLLRGSADASTDTPVREARTRAMRAYLDRRLREPDLGVDDLCRAFHAARATVYRDFAEEGGVARYLVKRRLEHALLDLAEQPPRRGGVQRVAESWGFSSTSHFSHTFRAQFGLRPNDALGLAQAPPAATPSQAHLPDDVRSAHARLVEIYDWAATL